jgi:sugar lactone lactonase YvrE
VVSGAAAALIDFAHLGLPGRPDGACTDASGDLWIACVHGSAVIHLNLTGQVIERVDMSVRRPTCPAFGGPDLGTMFLTSIGGGGIYPVFEDEPLAGRVLLLDVGVQGVPEHIFAG